MSIKIKIFTYLTAFCALLLVLLWMFQVVFLDNIYQSIKVSEVKSAMKTLEDNLNDENLADIADNIIKDQDINIGIIMDDGKVLHSYDGGNFERQKWLEQEKLRLYVKTVENNGEYFEYPSSDERSFSVMQPRVGRRNIQRMPQMAQTIIYSKMVSMSDERQAIIILYAVISPVNATVETIRVELYFITGFMILFSVILALLIARHVSKPIVSINKSAKVLASGKYNVLFDAKGYREIKELSDTLNAAAKELSKVDGLRRELIANISHDLRTPLTLIAGYAEAMRDLPDENTTENAQVIVDETKRLNRLVNDLLDLSKIQAGAQNIELARYNLTGSLSDTIERLSEFTKAGGYQIDFLYDGDVNIIADETLISQAFYNLLTNAVNFTGEDKRVIVRQTIEQNSVLVEVKDSGKGISNAELPYIWDKYYRTGKNHTRAAVGTGIGLSIVKSVIELHGGWYGVTSEPGHGCTFWIRLKIK